MGCSITITHNCRVTVERGGFLFRQLPVSLEIISYRRELPDLYTTLDAAPYYITYLIFQPPSILNQSHVQLNAYERIVTKRPTCQPAHVRLLQLFPNEPCHLESSPRTSVLFDVVSRSQKLESASFKAPK